jgi:hypothetical protein
MLRLFRKEPVVLALLVRSVFYALGAVGVFTVEPDTAERFAWALVAVLGLDTVTSVNARAKVTPMTRLEDEGITLPPSRKG